MKKEEYEIVKKIRTLTNGTYLPENVMSTLMGFCSKKDEYGRELNPDKNIKTGDIVVDDETYKIVNNNIYARIINENKGIDISIDIEPLYIKEYNDNEKYTDGIITEFISIHNNNSIITENFRSVCIEMAESVDRKVIGWSVRSNNRFDVIDINTQFAIETDYQYEHRNDKPENNPPFIYMPFILEENCNCIGNYINDIEIKKVYGTKEMVEDI